MFYDGKAQTLVVTKTFVIDVLEKESVFVLEYG